MAQVTWESFHNTADADDNTLMATTNWNGNVTLTTGDRLSVTFPGGLVFAFYPNADLWLFLGACRNTG